LVLDPQAPESVEPVTGVLVVVLDVVIAMGYITLAVLGRRRMRRLRLMSTTMIVLSALLIGSDEGDPGLDSLAFDVQGGLNSVDDLAAFISLLQVPRVTTMPDF
jgi:hypothetical protein